MSTFDAGTIEARLLLDRSRFTKDVTAATKQADKLDGRDITVNLVIQGMEDLLLLEQQINSIEDETVNVEVDAETAIAQAELSELVTLVESIEAMADLTVQVDADGVAETIAQLEALNATVESIDEHINIKADMDDGGISSSGGSLGLLKILIYSIIALLPVLSTMIGVAGGALGGIVSILISAGGAAGILAAGLVGLSQRLKDARKDGKAMSDEMSDASDALDNLKDSWNGFLDDIEPAGFSLIATALETLGMVLEDLAPIFNMVAGVAEDSLGKLQRFMGTDQWVVILDFFERFGSFAFGSLLDSIGNLILFLVNLAMAFRPFTFELLLGLEKLTAGWAEWAETAGNNTEFIGFLEWLSLRGPQVLDMLGSMVGAFIEIGKALDPLAGPFLDTLTKFFDMIANADPETLTTIATSILFFFGVFKLGIPAVEGLAATFGTGGILGILGLSGGTAGIVAAGLALAGLIGWMVLTTDTGKPFQDMWDQLNDIWVVVQEQAANIIDIFNDVKDALEDNGTIERFQEAFTNFGGIIEQLLPVLTPLAQLLGVSIVGALMALSYGLLIASQAAETFAQPFVWAAEKIAWVFNWLYDILLGHSIVPDIVNGTIGWFTRLINWFGGLRGRFAGMVSGWWSNLGTIAGKATGWVRDKFDALVSWFKRLKMPSFSGMFDGIKNAFRSAINWVIRGWNGLSFSIPGFNPPGPGSFPGVTIGTPNISLLAAGGLVNEATLAYIGEGNESEAVLPLSELWKMLDREREVVLNQDPDGRGSGDGPSSASMEAAIDRLIDEIRDLASRPTFGEYNDFGQRRDPDQIAEDLWLLIKGRG